MILQKIGQVCQMRKEQGKPNDPNCFDLMFSKSGTSRQTQYGVNFTGDETPLTAEELAYELNDLDVLTQLTTTADVEAIVGYLGASPDEQAAMASESTSFDPQKLSQKADPAQAAKEAMGATTVQGHPTDPNPFPAQQAAASPPTAAPAPAVPPGQTAESAPVAPQTAAPAPPQEDYADTTPQEGFDAKKFYQVPCGDCGKLMQISMGDDTRDMKCHGCGKIYSHPSKAEK
jgi:ribosomal protein S27E